MFDINSMTAKRRVLAVDDDLLVTTQIQSYTHEFGLACDTCRDPDDAIEKAAALQGVYVLIFMDFRFGEQTLGPMAARSIAERLSYDPPAIIGVTGFSDLYFYEQRKRWGMNDVILKPLHKFLILNLLSEYCL